MYSYLTSIIIYLVIINILSVYVTISDKVASKGNGFRTPEKALMFLSFVGGSLGMYITMLIIRHKTRHMKFMLGIPVIILIQVTLAVLVYYKWGSLLWAVP